LSHVELEKIMGKKSKAPPAPDFKALAIEQAALDLQANETATKANRVDQTNPFGSLTWAQDPTTGKWTQNTSLDPASQGQLDQMRGLTSSYMGNLDPSKIDLSGAPEMGEAGFGAVSQVQDQIRQLMQPDLDRRRASQEAAMVAQGVGGNTGGEAWDRTQQQLGRNENDAYLQALQPAMQEYGNIYNRQMSNRNQWLGEQQYQREQPMSELMAMLRGQQSYTNPDFNPFYHQQGASAADVLGAGQQQYAAQMDAYNAKKSNKSSLLGTIGGIAGGIFGGPAGAAAGSAIGGAIGGR
jgi:hypothetical protein